jgi:hypothetical protein
MSETTNNAAVTDAAAVDFPALTAALKAAIASGDKAQIDAAMSAVEAYTPPAAPVSKRTATDVKRQVSQAIVDTLSANLETLMAGPKDDPYTEAEQNVAKEKVANICGYLPNASKLTWPENFAPRTGRGLGRQTASEDSAE